MVIYYLNTVLFNYNFANYFYIFEISYFNY